MPDVEPKKERRFWEVDPGSIQRREKPTRIVRLLDRLRPVGSLLLVALAVSYPLIIVYLGIAYGGIVFWGSFSGSLVIIYIIISRLGAARNFRGRGTPLLKGLVAIVLSAGLASALYLSLFTLRLLTIPLVVCILILSLVYFIRK